MVRELVGLPSRSEQMEIYSLVFSGFNIYEYYCLYITRRDNSVSVTDTASLQSAACTDFNTHNTSLGPCHIMSLHDTLQQKNVTYYNKLEVRLYEHDCERGNDMSTSPRSPYSHLLLCCDVESSVR